MPDFDFSSLAAAVDFDNFRQAPVLETLADTSLLAPNPKLEQALTNSTAKGLPPISVVPMAGQHLSILTQLMGAKSVLEIGTLGGYSAICFAQGGAKVTSIEIDPKYRNVALENLEGLDVEVLLGAALDVLPKLAEEKRQFDMVFIDAYFEDHLEHFDWAVKLTRPGGCVFFDDVVASMFKNGEVKPGVDSILTHIGKDDRVKAALVPNVACHPMLPTPALNGFVMALVKDE
ncbi:S-adenosyl-L-methionine-dependent methyltransferase [Emericellopsis atlantica]|uniref:S-adenosyl-L-methionine-dependent methyltransferase n=1 Tax=Emericellopsis atlantica TaxID=2614577 RepID=A0A9P8CS43_9HYPO|nr:S-adenosyl-L-methionine-dependent methyltransferase [Emericellopsis atlantica]KAG9257428.1 S-adenosyl-L-methionine-dependent methyltransferase [Emericellopsis atlantica]